MLVTIGACSVLSVGLRLNGDVQQTLGGINVAGHGLLGAVDVFTHRPLVYRVYLDFSNALVSSWWSPGAREYEICVRLLSMLVAVAAAGALWAGLRHHLPRPDASAIAGAIGVVLVFAPVWTFLQPEWLGGVFVTAAVGLSLFTNRWLGAVTGGLFLAAAIGAKVATMPLGIAALVAVLLIDRRRARAFAAASAAWLAVWLAVSLALPHERIWLPDMVALAPGAPWRAGVSLYEVDLALRSLGSEAIEQPVMLVLPIAMAALIAGSSRLRGLSVTGMVVGGLLLALAPLVVQGVGYLYHAAALPIVAAAVLGLAYGRAWRRGDTAVLVAMMLAAVVVAALSGILLSLDPPSRDPRLLSLLLIAAIVSVGMSAAIPVLRRVNWGEPPRGWPVASVLAMVSILSLPALLPNAAWSLDPRITPRSNAAWGAASDAQRDRMLELSRAIGRNTEVLYLAYGTVAYHMGNPTGCRYASPSFLKVATRFAYVDGLATYRDNLACLAGAHEPYLVIDPGWIFDGPRAPALMRIVDARFDCTLAIAATSVRACPIRR